jgi:hypothetical protein
MTIEELEAELKEATAVYLKTGTGFDRMKDLQKDLEWLKREILRYADGSV